MSVHEVPSVDATYEAYEQLSGTISQFGVKADGQQLEPEVEYQFTTSPLIEAIYGVPNNPGQTSNYSAVVVPIVRGGTYWLTFKLIPQALLIVRDGAILAAGTRPAVGGQGVGTYGSGTTIVLESRSSGAQTGSDFVYLLDGTAATVFNVVIPADPVVDTLNAPGTVTEVPWPPPLAPVVPPPSVNDAARKEILRRLKMVAEPIGLWPATFVITP
jgi:hypothetical protein